MSRMKRPLTLKADKYGYTLYYRCMVKGKPVDKSIGHYTTLTAALKDAVEQSIKGTLSGAVYSLDRPGITALVKELESVDHQTRELLTGFRERLQGVLQERAVEAPEETK